MKLKNSNVVIAGGAGFVGTNLALKLSSEAVGAKVYATYHNREPQIQGDITYIKTDLTDKGQCFKLLQNMDYLFMTAGFVPGAGGVASEKLAFLTDPTIVNLRLLEAAYAAGVKKVCFVSSSSAYPYSKNVVTEKAALDGEVYPAYYFIGWHKRFSEIVCEMYGNRLSRSMPVVSVRIDNLYGPYDNFDPASSHVTASLIKKAVERQSPIEIWGGGEEIKDFSYIEDLVDGMILAMEYDSEGYELFNLASGRTVTINELLKIILKECNYQEAHLIYNSSKPSTIPIRKISIKKAERLLGYRPKTSLEKGIRKTIEWYKKQRYN